MASTNDHAAAFDAVLGWSMAGADLQRLLSTDEVVTAPGVLAALKPTAIGDLPAHIDACLWEEAYDAFKVAIGHMAGGGCESFLKFSTGKPTLASNQVVYVSSGVTPYCSVRACSAPTPT
jgi:hypothetical protein